VIRIIEPFRVGDAEAVLEEGNERGRAAEGSDANHRHSQQSAGAERVHAARLLRRRTGNWSSPDSLPMGGAT